MSLSSSFPFRDRRKNSAKKKYNSQDGRQHISRLIRIVFFSFFFTFPSEISENELYPAAFGGCSTSGDCRRMWPIPKLLH